MSALVTSPAPEGRVSDGPVLLASPDWVHTEAFLGLVQDLARTPGRLVLCCGEADVDAVTASWEEVTSRLSAVPEVAFASDEIEALARPGEFVLARGPSGAALAARGCIPLERMELPPRAESATGRLAAATGWARLEWIAECRSGSGYADEARMFLRALDDAGIEPALTGYPNAAPRVLLGSETERLLRRCESRRSPGATSFAIWHEKPLDPDLIAGRRWLICRTMFETDSLPVDWVHQINRFHQVWVPTQFNVETFEHAGVSPELIRVLPETIDLERFTPQQNPYRIPGAHGFTFLSNFTFQERKGWRELLAAYVLEFAGEPDVTLALKLGTGFVSEDAIRARIDAFLATLGVPATRRPRILLMHEHIPDIDMAGLYTGADAYVSPTRGEGWGRPLMEALACGCPVIASRWSGQLAFLDDDCSWLVDGDVVPVPDDIDNDTFLGQRWFAADLDCLRQAMREVVSDPARARARSLSARQRLERDYGLATIAERIATLTLEAMACL